MKYRRQRSKSGSISRRTEPTFTIEQAPTGAAVAGIEFLPWQPSTWPPAPRRFDSAFSEILERIFKESILDEISNVIVDVMKNNGDLQHRGHVVALSLMCALEAVSAYGYRNHCMANFIASHFPQDYKPHAERFYRLYRNSLVHSWNLFEATILPEMENVCEIQGTLSFGLLNFFEALKSGVTDFLTQLKTDRTLQRRCLKRYRDLKQTAKP